MRKRKPRLPITIKLWKNDTLINQSVCLKKTQILARTKGNKWDKAYIKVTYCEGYFNDSDHYSQESLENALNAYLETKTIDHALGGRNGL